MEWTKEQPTKTGWYWTRIGECKIQDDDLVYVKFNHLSKRFEAIEINEDEPVKMNYFGDYVEWYGPINPPTEE